MTVSLSLPPEISPIQVGLEIDGRSVQSAWCSESSIDLRCPVAFARGSVHAIRVFASIGFRVEAIAFETAGSAPFTCNLCGHASEDLADDLEPEGSPCAACGSNIRWRALVRLMSICIYDRSLPAPQWLRRPQIVALGISDNFMFEDVLPRAISYRNTQFDVALARPGTLHVDVTDPPSELVGKADVVTCSEVLEHVVPPVGRAFDGLYSLLKPGGHLIFTVPYALGDTIEHFPELHEWSIQGHADARVLVNETKERVRQEFHNLRFHGGGEEVLEMRVFGLASLIDRLEAAGFTDIRVRDDGDLPHGICWKYSWSLPLTCRRPRERVAYDIRQ